MKSKNATHIFFSFFVGSITSALFVVGGFRLAVCQFDSLNKKSAANKESAATDPRDTLSAVSIACQADVRVSIGGGTEFRQVSWRGHVLLSHNAGRKMVAIARLTAGKV